jgi:hypothetical protein
MRLESQRTLVLPGQPEEVFRLLSDPARLSVLAPEIEDAWPVKGGLWRLTARLGRRRRTWRSRLTLDEAARKLELTSATEEVVFNLTAQVEPAPEGAVVKVSLRFEPPEVWKANPQPGGIPARVVQRLLLAFILFALSAVGVVELPALELTRVEGAVAYGVVGATFVVAAALLSSTPNPRKGRRKGLFLGRGAKGS